jgi:flagellar hook-associated protein 1 FlgK
MGLSAALNSSLAGLRVTQSQMEVVSTNIANVDSVGYSRRKLNIVQQLSGSSTTGVRSAGIERQLEAQVQKQLRLETAGAAYTDVKASYAEQLDRLFGQPGQAGSLDSAVNAFTASLQALTANPADYTARSQVLNYASQLSSQLSGMTQDIQRMRSAAESQIGSSIDRVNSLLSQIKAVDTKLFANGQLDASSPGLLDERDRAVNELAGLIDIRTTIEPSGKMTIFTNGGLQLYGASAVKLTFDARGNLNANALFTTNPTNRGVGTIRVSSASGGGVDIIAGGLFRSGSIAAEVDIRDKVMVEAQTQLDDLAAALASTLGDRNPTTSVTSGANAGFDVALADVLVPANLAMKAGNTLAIEVNTPAGPQRYQFIATDGAAPNPIPASEGEGGATVIRYDRAGGFAGLQAAVAGALGGGFAVSLQPGNVLRVLDAGGGNSVTNVRASFSTSGLTGEGPELPLFVDAAAGNITFTGSLDGTNPQKRGFAGRIGVNANIISDNSRLVIYNTTPGAVTPQGDGTRPRLLLERMTNAQRAFSSGSGIGDPANGYRSTVVDFSRRVVEDQGAKATNAINIDEGQKIVLNSVQARFSETSGVSIDREMSDLVQIQNAYSANARVVGAIKELFDTLLRIGA